MAELSIRATLSGAAEAQAGLAALSAATKSLNVDNERLGAIQANLNRASQEHQTSMTQRTAATQRLKDHTAELVRKFQEQERAEKAVHSATSQLTSSISSMAFRFAATTFSVAAFGAALIKAFSSGREAQLALVKLDASLQATGGTVGKTTQQLVEMSEALAKGTRFDATGIQAAMNALLTFDNVQGKVFEDAIRHAQNLAEKTGMDLVSAARLMGRAYQEPGESIGAFSKQIGTINPQLITHIQNLNGMGRTAEAQAELTKLLDGRMKDFATTIGESAPASFDKMKIAWNNMLQEMGSTDAATGFFAFVEERLDNVTGFFKNWTLIMRGISIDRDLKFLNEASTTAEQRVIIEKRLNDTLTKLNEEADAEAQRRKDAELAMKVKQWNEEDAKKKTHAAKQLKDNEELTKKIMADEEAAVRTRLELINLEVKEKRMTLEQKVQLIDEEMFYQARGTAVWIALSKERLQALEEIDRREDANIKRVLERYDVDIKMSRATYEQKIQFIDAQLAREEDGSDKWIALMKARQQTEDQMVAKKKQNEAEIQTALKKTQRSFAEQADEAIDAIRRTVYATEDLRIEALDKLSRAYKNLGPEGEEAYDKIRKAMRGIETSAERTSKRLQGVFGEAGFDIVNVIGGVHSAWTATFADMIKGTITFQEGLKALWKAVVDAIIQEIARMVASYLLAMAKMKMMQMIGTAIGFAVGGPAGAAAGGTIAGAQPMMVAMGGDQVVTSPTTFLVGEGGVAMRSFAMGGEGVFTRPTLFRAGEGGPERVRVTPLAGGSDSGGGGVRIVNNFNGPNVMDAFSLRRFVREQERLISREMRRG